MATPHKTTWTDRFFRIAITLKGLDGAVQLIAGIVLIFIPPSAITEFSHAVITRDLLGDPGGKLSAHFQTAMADFADGGSRTFAIVFLLLHGLVKLGLVVAMLRKIMPAYPIAAVVLSAFVVYELYRATKTHSIVLPIFAVMDIVIIFFIIREYLELRRYRKSA